ncbi:hypothetical protein ACLMJK_003146 [Lecanora helva]
MKTRHWVLSLGFLAPESVFSQYTTTISIDTGSCVPTYKSGGPGGSVLSSASTTTSGSEVVPSGSATISAASPVSSAFTPPAPGDPFLVVVSPASPLKKRQSQPGYVGSDGQSTNNCYDSTEYVLSANGTLSTTDGRYFSTSPGVDSQPFVPSANLQSISTTWEFSNGNNLIWSNSQFQIDPAVICRNPDGTIEVYFQVEPPATCTRLGLSSAPLSDCPGIEASQSANAPSNTEAVGASTETGLSSVVAPTAFPSISGSIVSIATTDQSLPFSVVDMSSKAASTGFPSSADIISSSAEVMGSSTAAEVSSEAASSSLPPTDSVAMTSESSAPSTIAEVSSSAAMTSLPASEESTFPTSDVLSSEASSATEAASSDSGAASSSGVESSASYSSPSSTGPASSQSSAPTADGLAYHGYVGPTYNGNNDPAQYNGNSNYVVGGVASDINFDSSFTGDVTFPGQTQSINIASPAFAVVYQGYFLAPHTDTYTLTSGPDTDDFAYIWYGDKAKSQWTDSNDDGESELNTNSTSVTFQLNSGEEIPVTIVYVNAANAGGLHITISSGVGGLNVTDTTGYFVSPQASDGFSNGVGTTFYSAPPSNTASVVSSATEVASSSVAASSSEGVASSSSAAEISSASVEASSSAAGISSASVEASSSAGATASSSGPTASSTGSASGVPGLVYSVFTNPGYSTTNRAGSVAYFNNDSLPLVSCGVATGGIDFYTGTSSQLPGQTTSQDLSEVAIVFHGYFTPPTDGYYRFEPNDVSFSYVWTGQKAFTDWSSTNFDSDDSSATQFQGTQGVPIPITMLYVNDANTWPSGTQSGHAFLNLESRSPGPSDSATYSSDLTGLITQPNDGDTWSPLPLSECTVPTSCDANGFYQYYFGSGYVFSAGAPANYDQSPQTLPYPPSTSLSSIVSQCESNANSIGYQSLDIHFDDRDNQWYCVQYHGYSNDTTFWSDANSRVTEAFGYSHC